MNKSLIKRRPAINGGFKVLLVPTLLAERDRLRAALQLLTAFAAQTTGNGCSAEEGKFWDVFVASGMGIGDLVRQGRSALAKEGK